MRRLSPELKRSIIDASRRYRPKHCSTCREPDRFPELAKRHTIVAYCHPNGFIEWLCRSCLIKKVCIPNRASTKKIKRERVRFELLHRPKREKPDPVVQPVELTIVPNAPTPKPEPELEHGTLWPADPRWRWSSRYKCWEPAGLLQINGGLARCPECGYLVHDHPPLPDGRCGKCFNPLPKDRIEFYSTRPGNQDKPA